MKIEPAVVLEDLRYVKGIYRQISEVEIWAQCRIAVILQKKLFQIFSFYFGWKWKKWNYYKARLVEQ